MPPPSPQPDASHEPKPRFSSLRSRRFQNRVIAALLIAELVGLIGHPLFGWFAKHFVSTPAPLRYQAPVPMSGAQILLEVSQRAGSQRPAPRRRRYGYVRREDWRLSAGPGRPGSARLLPVTASSWLTASGQGLVQTRRPGGSEPTVNRRTAGHPLPNLTETTTPSTLGFGATGSAQEFLQLVTLAQSQPVPPHLLSAVLVSLAGLPGLSNRGSVVDRAGRPGIAVSINLADTATPRRYTLVFDPRTGALDECDEELLQDSSRLDAQAGAVVAYTVFLGSGYTSRPGVVPAG
ncbi:MAG: hypothetical protein QOF83_1028 [Solirubrobacteraceae bacterium]|nr:hypothetical protein [Solirubrobacteraceae bacterium]